LTDGNKLTGPGLKGISGRKQDITRVGVAATIKTYADYLRESIARFRVFRFVGKNWRKLTYIRSTTSPVA